MSAIKNKLRKLIPKIILDNFHYPESIFYSLKNGNPSKAIIVIGIVGSKGKTTTANYVWSVLNTAGYKTGQISTANIRIGDKEEPNIWHMTMPGAKKMQYLLNRMKKSGCSFVVMEVPSEAQTQWRHIGIEFDLIIFTGVEKEIMAAHRGSMEILHQHNQRVFAAVEKQSQKNINGKKIEKVLLANADSSDFNKYTQFSFDHKLSYSLDKPSDFRAKEVRISSMGTSFKINGYSYKIGLIGEVNALNAAAAVGVGYVFNIPPEKIQAGLKALKSIPGRMEKINCGQNFLVYVDYAHDPISIKKLLITGRQLIEKNKKLIVLFGGQGGGRDVEKRAVMGKFAGELADIVVISSDDPYDDDPMKIINDIAKGAKSANKIINKDLYLIEDRRVGINKALSLAKKGDLVFIACKGADQLMMLAQGQTIAWDDRKVTREELGKIINKT